MKIRNGFVSNSSSSSFVIAVNGELTLEKLMDGISEKSFHYPIIKEISETILNCAEKTSLKDFMDNYSWEEEDEIYEDYKFVIKANKNKWNIYYGSFSDDNGGIEAGLCSTPINFKNDDFIFFSEGEY